MEEDLILSPLGKYSPESAGLADHYVVLFQGERVGSIQIKPRAGGQQPLWFWTIACDLQGEREDVVPRRREGMTDSREAAMKEFRAAWRIVTPDLAAIRRRRRQALAYREREQYRIAHGMGFMDRAPTVGEILAWVDAGRPGRRF